MKATLYMPYFGYNSDFDAEGTYKTENDYVKAMENAYNQTKDVITSFMSDGAVKNYTGLDGQTYSFGQQESKKDKISYAPCEVTMFDEDGNADNVDNLITHFAKQEMFIDTVILDMTNINEDFQSELSIWVNEHESVNRNGAKFGGEWCWIHEPMRELRLSFKNKANETVYAKLINCKIGDMPQKNQILLFIEKMELIDSIDSN